jgi:hypothetical protein
MAQTLKKWITVQKKYRLSDKHIQMARELGLNPDKFGQLNNHDQELWKAPLPEFIEHIYYKRFKRESPKSVRPLAQILTEKKKKQQEKKSVRKIEKNDMANTDGNSVKADG